MVSSGVDKHKKTTFLWYVEGLSISNVLVYPYSPKTVPVDSGILGFVSRLNATGHVQVMVRSLCFPTCGGS